MPEVGARIKEEFHSGWKKSKASLREPAFFLGARARVGAGFYWQ
jgi:hypothetical protein